MELDEYLPVAGEDERPVRRRGGRGRARPRLAGARARLPRLARSPTSSGTCRRCSTSGPGSCGRGRRTRRPTWSRRAHPDDELLGWLVAAERGAGDGAGRRRPAPSGSGRGRRSRTSPSCCGGRPRRRRCTPSTSSRCSATSARSRPTSGWTASTSGSRSWCPGALPDGPPEDAHPVVLHAVDADAERTLFPGTRPFPIAALTGTAGDLLLAVWRRLPHRGAHRATATRSRPPR